MSHNFNGAFIDLKSMHLVVLAVADIKFDTGKANQTQIFQGLSLKGWRAAGITVQMPLIRTPEAAMLQTFMINLLT